MTEQPEHEHQHQDEHQEDVVDEVPAEVPDQAPDEVSAVTDPRIGQALARLEGLAERSPAEHVEVYEDVHRVLHESLTQAQEQRTGGATP